MNKDISTICPQCQHYPYITFPTEKPYEILMECDNCDYFQYLTIHSYLNLLNSLSNKNNDKCIKHNKKYIYFCIQCKVHLCAQCITLFILLILNL